MNGAGGLDYDRYTTSGGQEWLMRIGPAEGPPILFLPPLLEEMNRTRAFLAMIMRDLAGRGFGCWLVDFPGTGESERSLEACSWEDWRQAVADASAQVAERAGSPPLLASVRGGALLDDVAGGPRWRFAPAEGSSLARDLVRAAMAKPEELQTPVVNLAGYPIPQAIFSSLKDAAAGPGASIRTVRLASDRGEADLKVEGPALWRRSEPGNAPELATLLANDLANWSAQCAAS